MEVIKVKFRGEARNEGESKERRKFLDGPHRRDREDRDLMVQCHSVMRKDGHNDKHTIRDSGYRNSSKVRPKRNNKNGVSRPTGEDEKSRDVDIRLS